MKAPSNTSKPKVLCPRGPQLCRCVQVVDLGTQHFGNESNGSRKLYIGFETSTARHTFKDENGPEPFMLQVEYAWYMTSAKPTKTKLRAFVEKWFDKQFPSDEAAANFDFAKLLGKTAVITVAHTPKADGTLKAVIADIYPPEKGAEVPPAVNPLICYEVENGEDANFAKLPPFLREKIKESDEFAKPRRAVSNPTAPDDGDPGIGGEVAEPEIAADDIPF